MKDFDKCREVIEYTKTIWQEAEQNSRSTIARSNNAVAYMLEAVGHLMSLDNSDSVDYIQDVAIPFLRSGGISKFDAITLCEHLEAYYTKKRAKTKAQAIAAIIRDIYKEIFTVQVEFD